MGLQQAVQVIVAAIVAAANNTIQQFTALYNVLQGELLFVAEALGYPSAPVDLSGLDQDIQQIKADLSDMGSNVAATLNFVEAIKAQLDAGVPVTLPNPPPPGYGGASGGEAASAVWDFVLQPSNVKAGDWASDASQIQENLTFNNTLFPLPLNPLVGYSFIQGPGLGFNVNEAIFTFQPGPPLPGEDQLSYLTRVYPEASWFLASNDYYVTGDATDPDSQFTYTYLIPTWQWEMFAAGSANAIRIPPVWPGADKVTLGSSVAIATGVTIDEPMDGVILAVTSVPPSTSFFQFDDVKSYRYVGALSFYDDLGDQEWPQTYGFQSAIFTTQTMTRASGVKVRAVPGVVGTITPWTINP